MYLLTFIEYIHWFLNRHAASYDLKSLTADQGSMATPSATAVGHFGQFSCLGGSKLPSCFVNNIIWVRMFYCKHNTSLHKVGQRLLVDEVSVSHWNVLAAIDLAGTLGNKLEPCRKFGWTTCKCWWWRCLRLWVCGKRLRWTYVTNSRMCAWVYSLAPHYKQTLFFYVYWTVHHLDDWRIKSI